MSAVVPLRGRVLAVVVTYEPGAYLSRHLEALRTQVDSLVVIDNGSKNQDLINQAVLNAGCRLVANSRNVGMAAALSQAARIAETENFAWLATFDQDSLTPLGAFKNLIDLYDRHPHREQIGILTMGHRDRATGKEYHHRWDTLIEVDDWRSLRSTITSGSVIRVELFKQVGLFDDALFIDAVDHEFCLRVRKHGWLVIEARHAVLEHSIGDASEHKLLGRRIVCTHHSALRRYYMTRNHLEVYFRNLTTDPVWAGMGLLHFALSSFEAILYERDKLANFRAMLTGIVHFALRRFGPRS